MAALLQAINVIVEGFLVCEGVLTVVGWFHDLIEGTLIHYRSLATHRSMVGGLLFLLNAGALAALTVITGVAGGIGVHFLFAIHR